MSVLSASRMIAGVRQVMNVLAGNSFKLRDNAFRDAVRSTEALIQFCAEHEGDFKVPQLRAFLMALDADDKEAAKRAFRSMAFGGMGTFPDWIPSVKFPNETHSYVQVVFEALTVKWHDAASRLLK